MAVKSIVADVDMQYFKKPEEDYVGCKNQTIKTMVTHLHMWYVIATKEKPAIKYYFLAPWSDTPEAHITIFSRQLYRRQVD